MHHLDVLFTVFMEIFIIIRPLPTNIIVSYILPQFHRCNTLNTSRFLKLSGLCAVQSHLIVILFVSILTDSL